MPENTELRARIAKRGVSDSELTEGKSLVTGMQKKKLEQKQEAGEAQRSTRDRDAAVFVLVATPSDAAFEG